MLKRTIILSLTILLVLCLFLSCGLKKQEDQVVEGRYPEHSLYYSVKGDFPKYFYLWPNESKGIMIADTTKEYDSYGKITIKVSEEVYSSTTATIQAEIFFPSEGHKNINGMGIGIFDSLGLEKYIDGVWTPVAFVGNSEYYNDVFVSAWRFRPIENIPVEGETITMDINTEYLYEPLEPGHYRVILFLDDLTCRYGEFDVE